MPTKRHGGDLDAILATAVADRKRMNSNALGAFSLTLLGVASVVGAGIFVVTGDAAAHYAGPAVLISFVLAGIVAGLTALCYAELAASIPVAGSTYSYALAAFGSFVGWFIGWDLLLEYLFAASTVAVGWSGYLVSLAASCGIHIPHDLSAAPFGSDPGIVNLPALAIMLITSGALYVGTKESAVANNTMVILKLTILALVVAVGIFYVTSSNLEPFLVPHEGGFGHFGWSGVLRGAGDVKVPAIVNVLGYWLFGLPIGWLLAFPAGLGARGVWAGLVLGLAAVAVLLLVRTARLSRRPVARLLE